MGKSAVGIVLMTVSLFLSGCGGAVKQFPDDPQKEQDGANDVEQKEISVHADVAVYLLTHCPWAAEVVRSMVSLKREMGHALNLDFGFIGLLDENRKPDSKMGDHEIQTARLHICAATSSSEDQWLEYLECVYHGDRWKSMPGAFDECSLASGISKSKVEECVASGQGDLLLSRAYVASIESKILGSPTIVVGDVQYIGENSINALRRHICFNSGSPETRPPACDGLLPFPTVVATLLQDSRCDEPQLCKVLEEIALFEQIVPGLVLQRIDYTTPEGRHLYELIQKTGSDVSDLPLMILDRALASNRGAMERLDTYIQPFGEGYLIALGNGWDPTIEICNNQLDDTQNGKVDCDDPTCRQKLDCRSEVKGQLDLFVMSECPFFWDLVPRINAVLKHFGNNRAKLDLRLQFIGSEDGDELGSMHGDTEVAEDLRMVCAQDLWGKNYRFMEYVACRAKAMDSGAGSFENCVPSWMSIKKLKKCAEGKRGAKLLKKSFELADQVGIDGSPTWILNNRLPMEGRSSPRIVTSFCDHNEPKECTLEVEDGSEADFQKLGDKCE